MGGADRLQSGNFFYRILVTSTPTDIVKHLNELKDDQLRIEDDIIDLVYFARIDWASSWSLSHHQRERIAKRISKYKRQEVGAPGLIGE